MEYVAGKGTTGMSIAGLTTGVIGTLGTLGGLAAVHANGGNPGSAYVTKDELGYAQELARKDSEIALLKSEQNTEVKIADVYERIMTRVNADARAQADWNAQQMVNNAHMSGCIAANAAGIAALKDSCNKITKLVVPNSAICPGWDNMMP